MINEWLERDSANPDSLSQRPRVLLVLGNGPHTQLWAAERLEQNQSQAYPASSDVGRSPDRLCALGFGIFRMP
jgi:hypothetical protein